jgi:SAM-dependent methyltransferase
VGSDISANMVAHARERERRSPLGIDYLIGTPPDSLDAGFDLVLSVYVMPYATTRTELDDMCQTAARLLRPSGRLVTLPIHPDFPWDSPDYYEPYGFQIFAHSAPHDSDPLTLHLHFHGHNDTVTAHYWSRQTLEHALRRAGFHSVTWARHHVSDEGRTVHGADLWNRYLARPHAALLDCHR